MEKKIITASSVAELSSEDLGNGLLWGNLAIAGTSFLERCFSALVDAVKLSKLRMALRIAKLEENQKKTQSAIDAINEKIGLPAAEWAQTGTKELAVDILTNDLKATEAKEKKEEKAVFAGLEAKNENDTDAKIDKSEGAENAVSAAFDNMPHILGSESAQG